jgi:NADPH:quinone reductase-like Zn-dependent oxidoreductase
MPAGINGSAPQHALHALQATARIQPGETVLVTAAAGGTGQFAVQLAMLAGCHVIAVCGSEAKAAVAMQLGADHVIDYKRQDVQVGAGQVLQVGTDQVLQVGTGQVLQVGTDQVLQVGTDQVLQVGTGQVLQVGTGQVLQVGTGQVLQVGTRLAARSQPCIIAC